MTNQDLEHAFKAAMEAYQARQWKPAEQQFRTMTRTWPQCKEAWYQLASVYQQQGAWVEAVETFSQVLELDPEVQEVYFNLGLISLSQGKLSLAQGYWQRALDINPDYVEARLQLAQLLAQSGQGAAATALFLNLLQRQPELAEALQQLVREQIQRGQIFEAAALCQALLQDQSTARETPAIAPLILLQAQIQMALGQSDELRAGLQRLPTPWGAFLAEIYTEQTPPETFPAEPFPVAWLEVLPRDPRWYLQHKDTELNACLRQAANWESGDGLSSAFGRRRTLVWLADARSLLWQEWACRHLRALPSRVWDIVLVLQAEFLQLLLQTSTLETVTQVQTLPAGLGAAEEHLKALNADILLLGNPELDPLQFWLAQRRLAPLQLAWSAAFPSVHFEPEAPSALDGAVPLWPLPLADQEPQQEETSESEVVLALLGPAGFSAEAVTALKALAQRGPVQICAAILDLARAQSLSLELDLPLRTWRWLPELEAQIQAARVLWLAVPDPLYLALAEHYGRPLLTPEADPESALQSLKSPPQDWPWETYERHLPATYWVVELQDWFHRRRFNSSLSSSQAQAQTSLDWK